MIYILTDIGEYAEDGKYIESVWEINDNINIEKLYHGFISGKVMEKALKDSNWNSRKEMKLKSKLIKKHPISQYLIESGAKQLEFKEIYV